MSIKSQVAPKISRRGFLICSSALLCRAYAGEDSLESQNGLLLTRNRTSSLAGGLRTFLPPLFCTAYINPIYPAQAGQENIVARYPLSLVPQDTRYQFKRWRDKVKQLNPAHVMLGYLSVNNEVFSPGPGHDVINKARGEWVRWPTGYVPTAFNPPRRLFDLRSPKWRDSFLEACRVTLASYPYDGLYLDNCSVFRVAHPLPSVRTEMLESLQAALHQLRREYPNILLVANTRYNFAALNGEMNENRIRELDHEMTVFRGHQLPRLDLHQTLLEDAKDQETVKKEMIATFNRGGFYAAAVNYQKVYWFEIFDEVMDQYRRGG